MGLGSNVGFHARSKSKTNYQHAFKTQAHIGGGVVLAECILRPLATASNPEIPMLKILLACPPPLGHHKKLKTHHTNMFFIATPHSER
jgi:hypothetical protein